MQEIKPLLFALVLELFGVILALGGAPPFGFVFGGIGLVVAYDAMYRKRKS